MRTATVYRTTRSSIYRNAVHNCVQCVQSPSATANFKDNITTGKRWYIVYIVHTWQSIDILSSRSHPTILLQHVHHPAFHRTQIIVYIGYSVLHVYIKRLSRYDWQTQHNLLLDCLFFALCCYYSTVLIVQHYCIFKHLSLHFMFIYCKLTVLNRETLCWLSHQCQQVIIFNLESKYKSSKEEKEFNRFDGNWKFNKWVLLYFGSILSFQFEDALSVQVW